tara:strand:- start:11890 stop:12630 length:741 start_codon:yes stop_codon:yes gene_type:complete
MKAIIYAAGISSRMEDFVSDGLKGLYKIEDKFLIEYQLEWLKDYMIDEVVIVLGLEHQRYIDILGMSYKNIPIRYAYNPDYKTKGNMLSLWYAREFCNDDIIFTTSDLLCNRQDIDVFMSSENENKILVDRMNKELFNIDDPVKVQIDNENIIRIRKKLSEIDHVDGISIGIYKFSKDLMEILLEEIELKISNGQDDLSLYYPIDEVLKRKKVNPVYTKNSKWLDIDTPYELGLAQDYIRRGVIKV